VLANRLSANPKIRVLLVEAGDEEFRKDALNIPAMAAEHQRTYLDWNYVMEPQTTACQSFENKVSVLCYFIYLSSVKINVPSKLVLASTGHETSAHKKSLSTHRCSFQKCFCTYFIHVVPNTAESW